jgi:hypothetical protein
MLSGYANVLFVWEPYNIPAERNVATTLVLLLESLPVIAVDISWYVRALPSRLINAVIWRELPG